MDKKNKIKSAICAAIALAIVGCVIAFVLWTISLSGNTLFPTSWY